MTPWSWWVGHRASVEDEGSYDIDECSARDEAVLSGLRDTMPGDEFYIIEARCSTAKRHWRDEDKPVPFARTRNRELLTNGPSSDAPNPSQHTPENHHDR